MHSVIAQVVRGFTLGIPKLIHNVIVPDGARLPHDSATQTLITSHSIDYLEKYIF